MLSCHWAAAQTSEAAPSPAPQEEQADTVDDRNTSRASPARERLAKQARHLLAAVEPPPHPVWIPVDGIDTLAFWQEDTSGEPEGAILLLHDAGQSPRWPATLLNLHRHLPRFGWATLSIELPATATPEIPPRSIEQPPSTVDAGTPTDPEAETAATDPENTEAVDESQVVHEEALTANADAEPGEVAPNEAEPNTESTSPTAEQVEQSVNATISAAVAYLDQRGMRNIVILGEGLGTARALTYLNSTADSAEQSSIRALVMLDPSIPEPIAETFSTTLNNFQLPVFDLITSVNFAERTLAAQRRQLSEKSGHPAYFARQLTPAAGVANPQKESRISKAVRGFISRRASGREL